jgi:hypothetical protein
MEIAGSATCRGHRRVLAWSVWDLQNGASMKLVPTLWNRIGPRTGVGRPRRGGGPGWRGSAMGNQPWRRRGHRAVAALVALGVVLGGCTPARRAVGSSLRGKVRVATTVPTTTVPPTTTTTEQPGWTPVATVAGTIAIDTRVVPQSDGHVVTLFRFRVGVTRFALHAGSTDPAVSGAPVGPDSGQSIGPDEAPVLLAAFNGGFRTNTGVGGFELDSHVLVPLQSGLASLVIDVGGGAHVGVWGQGLPGFGEDVASVRQNLQALVVDGQPSPSVGDIGLWGATLGGGASVARSSLGEDADGNLVYAASMSALPSELASGLMEAGVVTGMELDINPEWVQLAFAAAPGAPLAAGIPGQQRPADQYQLGWTRDYVTVLAGG